jgi:hypothetical protein
MKPEIKVWGPASHRSGWSVVNAVSPNHALSLADFDSEDEAEAFAEACRETNLRPLTADEVEFTIRVEAEDVDPRDNFMCTDDTDQDRADENEIIERLNRGDESAWCCVVVEADWNGIKGYDSLGCCSYAPGSGREVKAQVDETVESHDMKAQALEHLNSQILAMAAKLAPIMQGNKP